MGVKPILPLLIGMSLPAMFSMLIQALYNVVDSIFVAHYNPDALQAVSLAYPLQLVLISFAVGTAVGVNSLIARRLGARNFKEANAAATTGMVLAVIDWLVFLLIGLIFSRPFISLFTDSQTVIDYGTQYLTVVLCASTGMMVSTMGEKILQATGNMIFPMLTQLLGAVINIILDPLLIYGYWIFPQMAPEAATVHLGISVENAHHIWKRTLSLYFDGMSDDELTRIEQKARTLGLLRIIDFAQRSAPAEHRELLTQQGIRMLHEAVGAV
jgi:Na+-driven multidrug efflux pump